MATAHAPEPLHDLPPSAELVYRVLDERGEAGVSDLDDELHCARSTIVRTLHRLRDAGVVQTRPDPDVPQRQLWHL